jgi:hypothetical protein
VENVADINVKRSVKSIADRSYILEQMIEKGEIAIIGAKHDLESGAVEFFDETMIACQADGREKMRYWDCGALAGISSCGSGGDCTRNPGGTVDQTCPA